MSGVSLYALMTYWFVILVGHMLLLACLEGHKLLEGRDSNLMLLFGGI
jgi:hypothetical protein